MDPLAHALAGTLLAKTHPSKARGLVWACMLGALIPDLDIVLTLVSHDFYVTEHRGFTHSLLGLLPMSWLAATAVRICLDRRGGKRASFRLLWGMSFLGVISHLLLDWCTSWGTMLLWPNRTRFSLDHLFIIDPWYWLLLALPLLAVFFFKENHARFCWMGILGVLGYHGLAAFEHAQAVSLVSREWPQAQHTAFPQPLSPFRWSAFNRSGGLLLNARIDFLKSPSALSWEKWKEPALTPEIQAAMDSPVGKTYLWFARMPQWRGVRQPDGSTVVDFWDMRFRNYMLEEKVVQRFGARFVVKDGKVIESQF